MSYNVNAAQGLKPYRYGTGALYNGAVNKYNIASAYATGLFQFDPVTVLADGTIGIGVAGSACLGVFMGVKYTDTTGFFWHRPNWIASTALATGTTAEALIADDPNLWFTMQETDAAGAAGTPLALADRNFNINFRIGTGNLATGQSTTSISNASEAGTATLNMKIMDLDPYPGNAVGTFANWIVAWNNHIFKGGTGTAGV